MTDNLPLVSVVIPAYNHAAYLAQAIDSVLAQDYPNVELIVLDDGSTDKTRDVLTTYDGKFYWETQRNMGQAATLNKGWRLANGTLLAYLSADDYLQPDAVSSSVAALRAHADAVVAYCDFDLVDPNGHLVRRVRAAEFSIAAMLTRFECPPGPGAVFTRNAFEQAGGWNPELKRMPDFEFWLRLARIGRFVRIPRSLAAWRVHEGSQSFAALSPDRAAEPVIIIQQFFAAPEPPHEIARLRNRALAQAHLVSAQLHVRSGRYAKGVENFYQAGKIAPGLLLHLMTWRLVLNALFNQFAHKLLWTTRRMFTKSTS